MTEPTRAEWCDLTAVDGAPAIRLRGDGVDVVHQLTPSEAAALVSRLARSLQTWLVPAGDRTGTTEAHPDHDPDPAA